MHNWVQKLVLGMLGLGWEECAEGFHPQLLGLKHQTQQVYGKSGFWVKLACLGGLLSRLPPGATAPSSSGGASRPTGSSLPPLASLLPYF